MKFNDGAGGIIYLNQNDSVASGGEGKIFIHPNNKNHAIKIYHDPKPHSFKAKFNELAPLSANNFVKPLSPLYNKNNGVAGFIMSYIDTSKYFVFKKLTSKTFCIQNKLDRKFKYKVYQNIKTALQNASNNNIIIGDLNPYNIFIDKNANVMFVDVDSYGTKSFPHNGVILDDVRDFVLDPHINEKTDCYAFNVLIFWMFTYVHPYRGMLAGYNSLKERAINCVSVLKKRTGLKLNNVYEEFTNPVIIEQFIEVFENKKRFIVDLAATQTTIAPQLNYIPPALNNKDVYIQMISQNILNIKCSKNLMSLKKDGYFEIFNLSNYGKASLKWNKHVDEAFIGQQNFLLLQDGKLIFNNNTIKNVTIENNNKIFSDYYGIMVFNENNTCIKINPDAIINNNADFDIMNCFYPSVNVEDAVLQQIGDKTFLLILNGTSHRTIPLEKNIKNAYYRHNVVLVEYIENNNVKYSLYSTKEYKIKHITDLDDFSYFGVNDDLIFIPGEEVIKVFSISSNKEILNIECKQCKSHSKIFYTNAGIVLYTDGNVYLLNKK